MPNHSRLLNEGEEVVVDVRPHWWYLAGPVVVLLLVAAGAIAAAVTSTPNWVIWIVVAALVVAAGWLLIRYVRWASTRLIITTSRLIHRTGVLTRRGREIPLTALTDISYEQSLFERIIGAGDILLESAGRDSQEIFPDLPRPARIQNEIYRQVDRARSRAYGGPPYGAPPYGHQPQPPANRPPDNQPAYGQPAHGQPAYGHPSYDPTREQQTVPMSVSDQLEQLGDLRRRGLISPEEFRAKKAELLDRL